MRVHPSRFASASQTSPALDLVAWNGQGRCAVFVCTRCRFLRWSELHPVARMKRILTESLALASASARTLFMSPCEPFFTKSWRIGEIEPVK